MNSQGKKKRTKILTPDDFRWLEFIDRLLTQEGCDFRFNRSGDLSYECFHDFRFCRRILQTYADVDVHATIDFFEQNGGYCDCEVFFNVDSRLNRKHIEELALAP